MTDYTPTTEQVRRYWQYGANAWADEVARDDDTQANGSSIGAEFDRWLAAHDAEVARAAKAEGKAEALEEAAEHMEASADIADDGYVANWFRAKANELRKVATDE